MLENIWEKKENNFGKTFGNKIFGKQIREKNFGKKILITKIYNTIDHCDTSFALLSAPLDKNRE